jgi:SAM-dependent methyltransferase
LNLYVGKLEFDKNSKKRIYKAVLFNPTNDENSTIHQAKIILDRNGKMMAKDPINGKYSEVMDDTIVEFVYDNNQPEFKWVPIRVRHDKTDRYKSGESIYGNNERTANDIWKNVSEPLTFSELSLGSISASEIKEEKSYYACKEYKPTERSPYQNFHNLIVKKSLIKEVAPQDGGRLLDLACGKAGDLNKWANAKYGEVVSIDIDRGCLDYAVEYYDSYNKSNKPDVTFIWGDTSKLIFPNYISALNQEAKVEMKKSLPSKYSFDVVSNQFCLHYYFESDIKLRSLLQNVNDNLKIGGNFIGTCFDGKRVVEELKNKKYIEGKKGDELIWRIEKLYSGAVFNSPRSQYDKNINVYVKSIDVVHKESLVDFDYFDKLLREYGFEKVKVTEFAEYYDKIDKNSNEGKVSIMGEEEKDFSFLNNAFIYKKVKHTPDNLYRKLVGMIDKKETSGIKKIKIKKV